MTDKSFDPQHFLHHLDGMDLTDAEKIEFIRTLWLITQCFVDDAYSARTDVDSSALKSSFASTNVINLDIPKQNSSVAANDNQKEPRARRKKA